MNFNLYRKATKDVRRNVVSSEPRADIVLIDPDFAQELLKRNTMNRKISQAHVKSITHDMENSDFDFNGDAIRLSKDGVLLDGQQRLTSIINSNKTIPTVFVRGLEKEAMDTIDSGRKRKHSDRLSIRGVSNASAVSAVLSNLVRLGKRYEGWGVITHKQLDNVLELHPRVVDSVSFTRKAFRNIENILAAVHYIGVYNNDEETASAFVQVFRDGQSTYDGDAAVFARNHLIDDMGKQNPSLRMGSKYRAKFVVQMYNKFAARKSVTTSRIPATFEVIGWDSDTLGV